MFEHKTGLLIRSMVGVSSIVRDITHRKQIVAALRERNALRYVASLAAAAAHEINNPLAVVVGNAQLLAEEVDARSEEHTSELQSRPHLVCRLLLEKKKKKRIEQFQKKHAKQLMTREVIINSRRL